MQTPIPENMKLARETSGKEVLLRWHTHQSSCGDPVWAVEWKSAAIKLANYMSTPFKASDEQL